MAETLAIELETMVLGRTGNSEEMKRQKRLCCQPFTFFIVPMIRLLSMMQEMVEASSATLRPQVLRLMRRHVYLSVGYGGILRIGASCGTGVI